MSVSCIMTGSSRRFLQKEYPPDNVSEMHFIPVPTTSDDAVALPRRRIQRERRSLTSVLLLIHVVTAPSLEPADQRLEMFTACDKNTLRVVPK